MAHISSLAMVFLLCVASSYAVNTVDVNTICKGVKNPSFCVTLLDSKPGENRDLVSLGLYTIDVTLANTTNTITLINMLISKSGGDAQAKHHYDRCLLHFNGIAAMLKQTPDFMKRGEYDTALQDAVGVRSHVRVCVSEDSDPHHPFYDSSELPIYANSVDQVAEVFAAILNHLNTPI
ncbi:unnamed protein product [Vicia faba]|uniref:Pectinesterase inhibitor domain-containing protein n=1 Tax=Vicia faba TaxID=3906 RepID=A0AAV0Z0W6_VICFA|nr:unnamed protein product [Vicia faba]